MVSVFDFPTLYGMKIVETPYLEPRAYAEMAAALKHHSDALITKALYETPMFIVKEPKMQTIDWNKPLEYVPNSNIPVKDSGHFNLNGHRIVFTMSGDKIVGVFYVRSDGTSTTAFDQRFHNKVTKFTRFDIIGVDGTPNWGPGLLRIREYGPKTRAEAERYQQRVAGKNWRDGTIVEMT